MNINNLKNFLNKGLNTLSLQIYEENKRLLFEYLEILLKYSKKINLIGIREPEKILEYHIIDSLAVMRILPEIKEFVDIGSGGGFPGLILKIVNPLLNATLVEPRQKRASFLDICVKTLKLKDVFVIEDRIENLYGSITTSLTISRAVFKFEKWLEIGSKILKNKGYLIAMTTKENKECNEKILQLIKKDTFSLPFSNKKRVNFLFQRVF